MSFLSSIKSTRRGDEFSLLIREGEDELRLGQLLGNSSQVEVGSKAVAISAVSAIFFAKILAALDGAVDRVLLLSPYLSAEIISKLMKQSDCDEIYSDREDIPERKIAVPYFKSDVCDTKWLMTTSGTTGVPKVVQHTFNTISASTKLSAGLADARWGLLYEQSRFAGLQVMFQALLGSGVLLAPPTSWSLGQKIDFLVSERCTHLSATPTLWRKILMWPASKQLCLEQITSGGEIADANLLAGLKLLQPQARISHIYASTEIGVGFAVHDGQAGFPISYLSDLPNLDMRVIDGVLWARSADARSGISAAHITRDIDGFVCTGDRVNVTPTRVFFLGRESSIVNVGGVKIQLEDVEAIVRSHPDVSECYIEVKTNSFSGSILTLTVSLVDVNAKSDSDVKRDLRQWCKEKLQREAQPATIRIVETIEASSAGKISRVT
jgi:acyl-coenzyme A synthetase/AMP-(fatty) acid ligase